MNNIFQKIRNYKFRGVGYYAMRGISNKRLRDTIINAIVSKRSKNSAYYSVNNSDFVDPDKLDRHVNNLRENGYTIFDHAVSTERLNRVLTFIKTLQCHDPYRKNIGSIDLSNPPLETHIAHYDRKELVNNKDILDIANDNGVLALAQEFLGATPTISNINMWWSFGGRKQAEEAQLYHRDVDDWKFCKFFIYLTDVSSENGPHIYVKGSSASPEYRKIRRYQDSEVEAKFGKENVISFERSKGSAFMVDTYGFHKGLLPKSGRRLLLQIQYSLNPLSVETYAPTNIGDSGVHFDTFINRLIISND